MGVPDAESRRGEPVTTQSVEQGRGHVTADHIFGRRPVGMIAFTTC